MGANLTACHAACIVRQASRHQSLVQVTWLASRGKQRARLWQAIPGLLRSSSLLTLTTLGVLPRSSQLQLRYATFKLGFNA